MTAAALALLAFLLLIDTWSLSIPTLVGSAALAAGTLLSRRLVFEMVLRGDLMRITLTEIPLVVGLTLLPGPAVVVAVTAVNAVVGALRRDEVAKWALNVSTSTITASIAALGVALFATGPTAPLWVVVLLSAVAGHAIGTATMLVGALLNQRQRRLRATLRFSANVFVVGALTAVAAIAAVEVIRTVRWGSLLVAVLVVALAAGYRAYYGLLHDQRDLGLVNEVSLRVARAGRAAEEAPATPSAPSIENLETALEITREQLNARRVVLHRSGGRDRSSLVAGEQLDVPLGQPLPALPLPPQPDMGAGDVHRLQLADLEPSERRALRARDAREVLVARLRCADGDLGVLEVHDRLRPSRGSGEADLRLIETLVSHLTTALDNQRLLAQLRHDAYHDRLTGLRNRLGFRAAGDERVIGGDRSAVIVLADLGLLESVNDALGHAWGDRIVREAGERLQDALPDGTLLARLEGDTFATLLEGVDEDGAEGAGERVRDLLAARYAQDGPALECDPVVGVALAPPDADHDVDELLQHADVALQAARRGGSRVRLYVASMGQGAARRSQLVRQFRGALHNGEIGVHLQPQLALGSRQLLGVEVLVRWEHPELGTLDPEEFVAVIENTGLIDALTTFVLDRALVQCRHWLDRDVRLSVAVNVSVRNLADPAFPQRVREALERHGVPASLLVLELTESAVMSDPARALPVLRALHSLGLRISVDDFGTGYSSLSYLRRLPVDEVKIDRSFVLGMESDLSDLAVVRAIIDLGRSLGLTVVAEGVEQDAARDKLREMGCDVVQGYLVSRPLPPERFDAWLDARTKRERGLHDEPVLRLAP